ncbi:MAG: glycosyltransferase family 4 protein [Candidatus Methylacidiphilales bacterium]|nr:glycosyltransferase family 4 protein [Candidatus Methylacidiphilales bacterium]
MRRRYRILHTEASLGWGGQEIRIFRELEWMKGQGHTVAVCAPRQSQIFARCQAAGIEAWHLNTKPLTGPWTVAKLTTRLLAWKADVVNTHSSRDGWIGGIAARLAGVRAVIRSRHIDTDYPAQLFWRNLGFSVLPHHLLTTSTRIADRLIHEVGAEPSRVTNLPTGIDTEMFHPGIQGTLHTELGLKPETPIIGMISVLRSWKGHPDFIGAARIVRDTCEKEGRVCHFIIGGGGPGMETLSEMLRQQGMERHITMLGHREDVPQLLASLAAVVLPSTAHEGVPQILLQAQAMARPVIGTTVGGIPEIVKHERTGLLVPPLNPAALAAAMLRVLRDSDFAAQLGKNALPIVRQHHSVDGMGHFLENLYAKILGDVV